MSNKYEWTTLVMRVFLGIAFFIHGLVKFQGGIENIAGWFSSIGLPGFLAYVVALLEVIGGIALVVGIGTKVVSGLFVILLAGAFFSVKLAVGFLGNGEMAGSELDLAFLVIALFLAVNGSRMLSLDQVFFRGSSGK